jgi:glycine/D-amino acid oxidase-like deaminating enzyme
VDVPARADVVVVGGGALGAGAAFHLRRLGVRDVVLLLRDTLASGSTSKAAGGIRTQFADELNIRIALRSLDEFERLQELTGVDISFRQHGYLFLLDREEDVAHAGGRRAVAAAPVDDGLLKRLLPPPRRAGRRVRRAVRRHHLRHGAQRSHR